MSMYTTINHHIASKSFILYIANTLPAARAIIAFLIRSCCLLHGLCQYSIPRVKNMSMEMGSAPRNTSRTVENGWMLEMSQKQSNKWHLWFYFVDFTIVYVWKCAHVKINMVDSIRFFFRLIFFLCLLPFHIERCWAADFRSTLRISNPYHKMPLAQIFKLFYLMAARFLHCSFDRNWILICFKWRPTFSDFHVCYTIFRPIFSTELISHRFRCRKFYFIFRANNELNSWKSSAVNKSGN